MSKWHGGKGSTSRKVDSEKFESNWERIFGKKTLVQLLDEEANRKQEEALEQNDVQRVSDQSVSNSDISREDVSYSKSNGGGR